VLVIEDDVALCEAVATLLREQGFVVVEAADGAHAIRTLHELGDDEHFCMVLLDMRLPEVDGIGILRYLQQHADQMPMIVALSASRELLAQAILVGVSVAIVKPFEVGDLLAVVARHCPTEHTQPDVG
jgi:DNA-binding response OmpR family regulator